MNGLLLCKKKFNCPRMKRDALEQWVMLMNKGRKEGMSAEKNRCKRNQKMFCYLFNRNRKATWKTISSSPTHNQPKLYNLWHLISSCHLCPIPSIVWLSAPLTSKYECECFNNPISLWGFVFSPKPQSWSELFKFLSVHQVFDQKKPVKKGITKVNHPVM